MQTPQYTDKTLQRRDLLALEPQLSEFLGRLVPFTAHGLYFPQDRIPTESVWIARERKLLIPLLHHGAALGIFIASGVSARDAKKVLPLLPQLVSLCLDAVLLYKQSRTDTLTGLARREDLLERMAQDADMVRTQLSHAPDSLDSSDSLAAPYADTAGSMPLYRACMGLVLVRVDNLEEVGRVHGYGLADSLVQTLAQAVQATVPQEVLAARTRDGEFTLLMPAATRNVCQKMAEQLLQALDAVKVPHPLTGRQICARFSIGHALYPQDMEGAQFALSMEEQSRLLLHKARIAARVASQKAVAIGSAPISAPIDGGLSKPTWRIMAFGRILLEGGLVREMQALGRVCISLGRNTGAKEGQRFSVWALNAALPAPQYKGEVVIVDVREEDSIAECLHVADPAWPVEVGDTLAFLAESSPEHAPHTVGGGTPARLLRQVDSVTGLLRHGDFLHCLGQERENYTAFGLALLRVTQQSAQVGALQGEQTMAEVAELCRQYLSAAVQQNAGDPAYFGGRFGGNSVIFFHPLGSVVALEAMYEGVCSALTQRGIHASVGLATYPFLKFRKGEMLECCQKALDFALLLPDQRVGLFGSLALNISADKLYSQGDVFAAVEEYKLALLADSSNAMAWNSLGVCMAALSRHNEARRYFKEALKRSPDDGATLYNLGVVCQNLGEKRSAARHFRACIKADPQHVFGHIRLGQMAERSGRLKDARAFHSRAAALEDQSGTGNSGLARRHLARVALRQRKPHEARELLHEALVRNPQDALAMQMLASLYLDGGEDPGMAEMLARQSVGLHPDNKQTWVLLARALQALGREKDAHAALACAEKL
ncbi:MAG: tetratricopeptide repeat protein [Desulfovibrionaceae bacterium]